MTGAAIALDEAFSPAEAAYFKSGGEDSNGLLSELSRGLEEAKAQDNRAPAKPAQQALDELSDDPDDIPADGRQNVVPHGAFHKERERRKAVEAELSTWREKYSRVDERVNLLNEIINTKEPQKAAEPEATIDPEQDLFGAFRQLSQRYNQLETRFQGSKTESDAQHAERGLKDAYHQDATRFAKENEDFAPAYQHLLQSRDRALQVMGYDDPAERTRLIVQEERNVAAKAISAGKSPSKMIYDLAVASGFAPSGKAQTPQANREAEQAPDQQPSPADKLEQIKRGQQASASLSNFGKSGGAGLTKEMLDAMDEDEFGVTMSKLSKADQRRLLGD